MDWNWSGSIDQLWRSPTFPMWLTLAAAVFFALVLVVTLLRAERSVANGALTVITLLAVAVAAAATMRGFGSTGEGSAAARAPIQVNASLPALSCLDELSGDSVEAACENALFGSPEAVAAAVSYAAAQITSLTAVGDVSAANKAMTPEFQALRHAVERDRYGLIAHVLAARNRCTSTRCAAFESLTDHNQIVANMEEHAYDGLVSRHAPSWTTGSGLAPVAAAATAAAGINAPLSVPTGKPTNAEFPTAASIPPISIMTPEPAPARAEPTPEARSANAKTSPPHRGAPAKRAAPAKPQAIAPPVQLAPAAADR